MNKAVRLLGSSHTAPFHATVRLGMLVGSHSAQANQGARRAGGRGRDCIVGRACQDDSAGESGSVLSDCSHTGEKKKRSVESVHGEALTCEPARCAIAMDAVKANSLRWETSENEDGTPWALRTLPTGPFSYRWQMPTAMRGSVSPSSRLGLREAVASAW